MSAGEPRLAASVRACVETAASVELDVTAAIEEAEAMLDEARVLGVATAVDDVDSVIAGLEAAQAMIRHVSSELQTLSRRVDAFDGSGSGGTTGSVLKPVIEVPGVGRVPAGHRLGRIPAEDFRPGIHEFGENCTFLEKERDIARILLHREPNVAIHAWANDQGRSEAPNPDGVIRRSATSEGSPVEFKTLDSPTSQSLRDRIRTAAAQVFAHGGGEVVIDGRPAGLARADAQRGCARFLGAAHANRSYVPARLTIILPGNDVYEPETGRDGNL